MVSNRSIIWVVAAFVLLITTSSLAFEDTGLNQAVKLELAKLGVEDDLTAITHLNLRDLKIESIAGIEQLKNLELLDLRANPISDISYLQELTNLKNLNLRETLITDISPLQYLINLEYLNLHSTHVQNIKALENLVNIRTLILRNVYIGDQINFLADLTQLNRLNIRNTGISDLSVLAGLMAVGALQDDQSKGILAEVDIRDNQLNADPRNDDYAVLRPYWCNIALRDPKILPELNDQIVFINEIMSSNGNSISDYEGDHPDWIELYNPRDYDVDLSGYYLTDDWNQLDKWVFPEGTIINANSFLVIFASGKDLCKSGEIHANFSINAMGEPLIISDDAFTLIDYIPPVVIARDVSYGRFPDGSHELYHFILPTPNSPNSEIGSYVP